MDRTLQLLYGLRPDVRNRAWWLIYYARSAGIPLVVTSARRSLVEQRQLVAAGRSRTLSSKHLAGKAFDVGFYGTVPDAVPASSWSYVGDLGKQLGLTWGGDWSGFVDKPHFEVA